MDFLLKRESKFPGENFEPGDELKEIFEENCQILVIGAGGLGCEILKNLALCKVKNIFVVDLDTIELSNLNRQFLFRKEDIGKYKSDIAAAYIKNKYPDINIKSSTKKIQDFSDEFFRQFHVIIGGLDNVEARRYVNEKIHDLVQYDEAGNILPESVIPYIDGGTEGFRGQSRLIIPYKTACFECTMSTTANRNTYALCTIAETPRIPEHCIEYAYIVEWKKEHDKPVDKDSIDDVTWIYNKAKERSEKYGISGVTYNLTLGVIKGIIPAIASTNALIAASCVMEAIKIITGCSKPLNNYFMYMGHEGVYSDTTEYQPSPNCRVCQCRIKTFKLGKDVKWEQAYINIKGNLNLGNEINVLNHKADNFVHEGVVQDAFKNMTLDEMFKSEYLSKSKYLIFDDISREIPNKVKIEIE